MDFLFCYHPKKYVSVFVFLCGKVHSQVPLLKDFIRQRPNL